MSEEQGLSEARIIAGLSEILQSFIPRYRQFEERLLEVIRSWCEQRCLQNVWINALELGCGMGKTSRLIASINEKIHLVSVEPDQALARILYSALGRPEPAYRSLYDHDRVAFVGRELLDHLTPPYTSKNSVELLVMVNTVHNLSPLHREELFEAIYPVMQQNSYLVCAGRVAHPSNVVEQEIHSLLIERIKAYDFKHEDASRNFLLALLNKWYEQGVTENELYRLLAPWKRLNCKILYRNGLQAIVVAEKV